MGAAIPSRPLGLALRVGVALGALAGATALFHYVVPANPTTVALSYLLLVLLAATEWGLLEATLLAAAASLAYNLFFLPPVGRLTIADPENWASLVAFMLTAIVVSQLSGRVRARQLDAVARQRDLERLYTLSRGLLLAEEGGAAPTGIARHIADAFELDGLALYESPHGGDRAGRPDRPAGHRRPAARRGPPGDHVARAGRDRGHGRPPRPGAHWQPRHPRWHDERHGAAVGRQPRGHRPGAGARAGGGDGHRDGPPQRRAARRPPRRRGAPSSRRR